MELSELINQHSDRLHRKKNVVGVAVGKKWVNGKPTDQDAILVLVEKKEKLSDLAPIDQIESSIDGHIVDVVGKMGQLTKLNFTVKERPISAGISCGHLWVTAGTVGGVFHDREGSLVVLSNNHVLAAENRGKRGNLALQPGVYDGGKTTDRFGLLKYYRPLVNGTGTSFDAFNWRQIRGYNVEDSATAQVDSPALVTDLVKQIGKINGFNDNVTVGQTVQKTGRTTGHTTGTVIGTNADVWVTFGIGTLRFRDCIITTNMSAGGDSGSLLLDMDRNAVGLLFAGSNTVTIHNPIKYPRSTYGLSIYSTRDVEETLEVVVKHNDVIIANNYISSSDLKRAVDDAYVKAKMDGIQVQVSVNYIANPLD